MQPALFRWMLIAGSLFLLVATGCAEGEVEERQDDEIREVGDHRIDDDQQDDDSDDDLLCEDVDCPGDDVCDPQTGDCVDCLGDDDCPDDDVCTDDHTCVADETGQSCNIDDDCSGDLVCDGDHCVECTDDDHCPGDDVCDDQTNNCQDDDGGDECFIDDECSGDDVCDDGDCVECASDTDCDDPDYQCDTSTNQCEFAGECTSEDDCSGDDVCDDGDCVECIDETHCTDGDVCDQNQCVECTSDTHCDDADYECDTSTNQCEFTGECTSEDDCPGDDVCDTDDNVCVECIEGEDHCTDGDVCDQNQCVACLENDDCPGDLVCDDTVPTCVECTLDNHCDDGVCDTAQNVCQPEDDDCCTFASEQVPTGDISAFSNHGFDFALDDDGEPVVVIFDHDVPQLHIAERSGGTWSSQIAMDLSAYDTDLLVPVEVTIGPDGQPHVVIATRYTLIYAWREGGSFNFEHLAEIDPGMFWSAAIATGSDGHVHVIGGKSENSDISFYYERFDDDGNTISDGQHILNESDETVYGIDMEVAQNDEPRMLLTMGDDDAQILSPDDSTASSWDGGSIGTPTDGFVALDLDSDDDPWAILRPQGSNDIESWRFQGTGNDDWDDWNTEVLSTGGGYHPDIAVSNTDDPHVSFATGDSSPYELSYGRLVGSVWEQHYLDDIDITDIAVGGASRTTVDAGTPHIVGRLDAGFTLQYFVLD